MLCWHILFYTPFIIMMKLNQLDTPALIVDLDVVEKNLSSMQSRINQLGMKLRPHTKAHKTPELALQQIAHGAEGVCTSKLGEAEIMAAGGVTDILITTPIANPMKYQRLIDLHLRHPEGKFSQVIDHADHVIAIGSLAAQAGISVDLLIEVESGQQRCGVAVGNDLTKLIQLILQTPGVNYRGIQAYSGHLQQVKGYENRNAQARDAVVNLFHFIEETLRPMGLAPEVVSGGGTGTFEAYQGLGFTEMQAGSYIFMDASYRRIGDEVNDTTNKQFLPALKVWTTVISHPTPQRAVVDAGMKSLSIDLGMPEVEAFPEVKYQTGGDEHGILNLPDNPQALSIGQQLMIIPSHCDTTLNNFDTLYGMRNGDIVETWKIAGRGRSD